MTSTSRWRELEKSVPWVWQGCALYAFGGLAVSSYYLVTLDASEACYKCRTDAWGASRQLEGLDELLGWLEWSATGATDANGRRRARRVRGAAVPRSAP